MEDDMNIDIHENDCIVVETKGDEVGKRSPRWVGSPDPADAGASRIAMSFTESHCQ
jgi:hypothetical protein